MANVFMAIVDVDIIIADIVMEVVTEVHSVTSEFADVIMDTIHIVDHVMIIP